MDKDDNSGGNGIKKDANVTVVFRQSAGILNPREVGDYEVWVRVTDGNGNDPNGAADDTEASVFVQARLLADSDDGKRGDELTLVASGVEAKESVTSSGMPMAMESVRLPKQTCVPWWLMATASPLAPSPSPHRLLFWEKAVTAHYLG